MSDFPDFSSNPPSKEHETTADDPEADFLARERAALGSDADFITGQETSLPTSGSSSSPSGGDDFSGFVADPITSPSHGDEDVAKFEHEFPDVDIAAPVSVFPETVMEWREKQAAVIAEREAKAAEAKAHTQESARKALDRFYEDYNAKKAKNIERNRERQEEEGHEYESGNVWERVCQLSGIGDRGETKAESGSIRPTQGVRDKSRMRQVLLDLRRDPRAPGLVKSE
ncbi:MAG: clathrin light chain [Piptocephalis tieghemiana]|nr:MAG: clathrin light chain [Piptocephalis tieghemiana]